MDSVGVYVPAATHTSPFAVASAVARALMAACTVFLAFAQVKPFLLSSPSDLTYIMRLASSASYSLTPMEMMVFPVASLEVRS